MGQIHLLYKRNSWLEVYFDYKNSSYLVIEDYFHKRKFLFENVVFFHVLSFCSTFTQKNKITQFLQTNFKLSKSEIYEIINQLLEKNLLITKSSACYIAEKKSKKWRKYNWYDALDYFISIKDYPFLDYESPEARNVDSGLMEAYFKKNPIPQIYKHYNGVKKIQLEQDHSSLSKVDLKDLLIEKVFDADSTQLPLTRRQISTIFYTTFGETGKVEFPLQGKFLLKTSPSGGARHPIEAYLISINTEIPRGIYHYSVKTNSLEEISSRVNMKLIHDTIYELTTGPQFEIKAIIVFSAVFPRSMWRYREPRSYRVILHDLGHLLETMKIVCKAVGTKSYYGHGFHDSKIAKLLKISGSDEAVLKFAAIS